MYMVLVRLESMQVWTTVHLGRRLGYLAVKLEKLVNMNFHPEVSRCDTDIEVKPL